MIKRVNRLYCSKRTTSSSSVRTNDSVNDQTKPSADDNQMKTFNNVDALSHATVPNISFHGSTTQCHSDNDSTINHANNYHLYPFERDKRKLHMESVVQKMISSMNRRENLAKVCTRR
jgi:hypothetical protein